jgi:hypothetical protein
MATVFDPKLVPLLDNNIRIWPEIKFETSCHINKTIYKNVGCDCEYL